jgi:FAD:protein FMN transferase
MSQPAAEPIHRFACEAMNTTFEVFIVGEEKVYAGQAAQEAFLEVEKLERELSRFDSGSDVAQLSRLKAGERLRVGLPTFECLTIARQVWADTGGAFDVTVGSLMNIWRNKDKSPRTPTDEELATARARTGMNLLELSADDHSVSIKADRVQIDLGAVGKGYAVDRMMAILVDWSIKRAMVHGGRSSILAMGAPPAAPRVGDERGWKLAICKDEGETPPLGYIRLKDRSLSGSASPKSAQHIVDPRTGRMSEANRDAWVVADTGALSDCLSTAFVVLSVDEVTDYCKKHPAVSTMILPKTDGAKTISIGKWDSFYEVNPAAK